MATAADRDLIAHQYSNGFHEVLDVVLPWLLEGDARLPDRIVLAHVRLMSQYPDSLIARKCGQSVAQEAAARAAMVLSIRGCGEESYRRAWPTWISGSAATNTAATPEPRPTCSPPPCLRPCAMTGSDRRLVEARRIESEGELALAETQRRRAGGAGGWKRGGHGTQYTLRLRVSAREHSSPISQKGHS